MVMVFFSCIAIVVIAIFRCQDILSGHSIFSGHGILNNQGIFLDVMIFYLSWDFYW